jgi:hypothetical protein
MAPAAEKKRDAGDLLHASQDTPMQKLLMTLEESGAGAALFEKTSSKLRR